VLSSNPTFQISYHIQLQDAENGINQLPNNYTTSNEIIYVRLQNTNVVTCYDIAPVNLIVHPAGIYTVTVTDENGCNTSDEINITNYLETVITDVEVQQFTASSNSISISVSGSGPWQYSLDDFIYQDEPVFRNLLPGYYTIYVRDMNGCAITTADATIVAAPNFFTPNGDGFNDFWQVIAIETEPDARIFIFDRFGKLLKQLSPTGIGWDGTYNGNPMPSSDYWFRVELNDGRMFRGHFSLKR